MSQRPRVNTESIRSVNQSTWPQYPNNELLRTPEKRLRVRDGMGLAYDVDRPHAPGEKFPAFQRVTYLF